jgi:LysM repeat protein
MDTRRRSITLRILAPLALIAAGLALFLIVSSASNSSSSTVRSPSAAEKQRDLGTSTRKSRRRTSTTRGKLPTKIYIVKNGDTLGSISQVTGVPVQTLQDLNPGLDQFSLQTGQKLKLR